jgi:hypothetical protein
MVTNVSDISYETSYATDLSIDSRGKSVDPIANRCAQRSKRHDTCDSDQRGRDRVFGKLKAGFIAKKILQHVLLPFRMGQPLKEPAARFTRVNSTKARRAP